MYVVGADGRQWKVVRRWWAWKPKVNRHLASLSNSIELLDNPVTALLALGLALIGLPLLLWLVSKWVVNILITPFVLVVRVSGGQWPVVARRTDEDDVEYRGTAGGWTGSERLIAQATDEIRQFSQPRSLMP